MAKVLKKRGIRFFRGSEKNVLNRYYETSKKIKADVIVRVTGDCPLIDPILVDQCINGFKESNVDFFSNTDPS